MSSFRISRVIAALLALGMLASMLVVPTVAKEANMIENGDFRRGLSGWQHWLQDPASSSLSVAKKAGPDGSDCIKITNTKPVAASLFQFVGCQQGKKYMLTCDVKYEGVSVEGSGVVLGTAAYDAGNNNIGEGLSTSSFGTSDWRTVSYVFEVTNNPARMNVGARLWFSAGTLYVDNVSLVELKDVPAQSGTYDLELACTPNRHTVNALGCEWDPKLLLDVNEKHGVTAEDLEIIKADMDRLGLQAVRMMVQPDWFEKANDNADPKVADPAGFDFDNDEMRSLFAYLKVCEELGVRVTLTWWGAPAGHWLACENIGDWIGAPNDLDEMAENIAYLLKYIREELKYNCVKELILQNEPSYSFKVDGGAVDFNYYVDYYKTVHARLAADGMSDIVLVGGDDSQHYGWYYQSYEALRDICGKFNSHNYAWSYDLPYLDVLAQEFVSARTGISGDTPFYLGEFGDGSTVGAYVATSADTFGRGIYVASVVVNAFKAGAAGASYWPLHDVYYYENTAGGDNGGLMSQGLISYKKDGAWGYRPTYYAYGLLCNLVPYGSEIYNVEGNTDHYVDTVAAKTPDGRWSILAVNRSDAAQTVNISVGEGTVTGCLDRYTFAEGALPTDGSMIAPSGTVAPSNRCYTVEVPACSFVVLSSIGMTEDEMNGTSNETGTAGSTGETADTPTNDTTAGPIGDTAVPGEDTTVAEVTKGGCASAVGLAAPALLSLPAVCLLSKKKTARRRRDHR